MIVYVTIMPCQRSHKRKIPTTPLGIIDNSVQCSKEESELMKTQIDSEVVNVCNTTKTWESSNCVHCHLISSTDVSTAVSKLKTDKVNDNGMIILKQFYTRN